MHGEICDFLVAKFIKQYSVPGYLQHALTLAEVNRKKVKRIVSNDKIVRKVWKLKDTDKQSNLNEFESQ